MAITKAKRYRESYSAIATSSVISMQDLKSRISSTSALLANLNSVSNHNLNIVVISQETTEVKVFKLDNELTSNITITLIPFNEFWTEKTIVSSFIHNDFTNKAIFLFEDMTYKQIVTHFAVFGIVISGGSNTKKHILSPIQLRLARFIIAIEGAQSSQKVAVSFHDIENEPKIDLTTIKSREELGEVREQLNLKSITNNDASNSKSDENKGEIKNIQSRINKFSGGRRRGYHTSSKRQNNKSFLLPIILAKLDLPSTDEP